MQTGSKDEPLCFQETIKGIKRPRFIQQLISVHKMLAQTVAEDWWCGWNETVTGIFLPLIQRIYKGQQYPNLSSEGTKRGRGLRILRLQSDYILYIQTNRLEKLKGWHSQCWVWLVTTFMDRDACLDSILVYVQKQIKVEEGGLPLLSNKNKC